MAEEGFKRKLTAILSADAVGYSYNLELLFAPLSCGTHIGGKSNRRFS